MDISYYYQILDIGILYEKGKKSGKIWRIGERKRLQEENLFWQNILDYIIAERKGITCSEELFKNLEELCKKYNFPNYERILGKKDELIGNNYVFERNEEDEVKIHSFMKQLLIDMERNLENRNKEVVYQILLVLHVLPKTMHGKNILNENSNLVSFNDALEYARSYMNESMKKKYEKYFSYD